MKQSQDKSTVDMDDIFVWPCRSWCYRYEFEQMSHLSDDFDVLYFNTDEYKKFLAAYYA